MKITSPRLFYFSLASLIATLLIGYEFHQAISPTITRDFNFGVPIVYGLIIMQALVAVGGIGASLRKRS